MKPDDVVRSSLAEPAGRPHDQSVRKGLPGTAHDRHVDQARSRVARGVQAYIVRSEPIADQVFQDLLVRQVLAAASNADGDVLDARRRDFDLKVSRTRANGLARRNSTVPTTLLRSTVTVRGMIRPFASPPSICAWRLSSMCSGRSTPARPPAFQPPLAYSS